MTARAFRQFANDGLSTLVFVAANGRSDSMYIEIVCLADGFTDPVQAFNYGVTAFHDVLPDGSSSGVQMMGGAKPEARHVTSMVLRMRAFARCLQFHVKR